MSIRGRSVFTLKNSRPLFCPDYPATGSSVHNKSSGLASFSIKIEHVLRY
nr:MAG TPA: hypothetical protein [Caudoviricetes sp.]